MRVRKSLTAALLSACATLSITTATANATSTFTGTIWQGMPINAYGGRCTLSVANEHIAYTALHCGDGHWKVGQVITAIPSNTAIGRVVALGSDLPEGQKIDAVKIKLYPGVTARSDVRAGDSTALKAGDPVSIKAPGNANKGKVIDPHGKKYPFKDQRFPSELLKTSVLTFQGDSGGPLLNDQNKVVGILSRNDGVHNSYFVPLHIIQERLK